MNEMRTFVQSKFNEISEIESGVPIPDSVVEEGKTYFGYELQEDYLDSDFDRNYTMQITLTGRIVRKNSFEENTLELIDIASTKLKEKLKEMNFKYNFKDITLEENVRKTLVTANVKYNEINKKFIV